MTELIEDPTHDMPLIPEVVPDRAATAAHEQYTHDQMVRRTRIDIPRPIPASVRRTNRMRLDRDLVRIMARSEQGIVNRPTA